MLVEAEGLGKGRQSHATVVHGLGREHLGARGAHEARAHALDGHIGVEDLAAARVVMARADGGKRRVCVAHPAHRRTVDVQRVEARVVGLLLHHHGIAKADGIEGFVPFEDGGAYGVAVLQRHVAVDPESDGLDGLRDLGCRVFLLQPPARHDALARRVRGVVAEIQHRRGEVADACVSAARCHGRGRQWRQRVVQADEHAARVGQVARHLRRGQVGHASEVEGRQVAAVEVALRLDDGRFGRTARRRDDGVAAVQAVALAVGALQLHAHAEHVGEEERASIDQDALALGVRQARHRRAAQEAGREGAGHRSRFGRAGLGVGIGVARLQAHVVVDADELDDLRAARPAHRIGHQAAEHGAFANAVLDLGREQEELAELRRREFDPQLLVLLPHHQRPANARGVAHHRGKGWQRTGRRGSRRWVGP